MSMAHRRIYAHHCLANARQILQLRIQPLHLPLVRRARVEDALMTAERFSRPKLNPLRHEAETRPERWARYLADSESKRGFGNFSLQLEIAFHCSRLP